MDQIPRKSENIREYKIFISRAEMSQVISWGIVGDD